MLRFKCTENYEGSIMFEAVNERGESRDFWPEGSGKGDLKLWTTMPITAAMFEVGKEYEVVIHEKHPPITPLVSPA